MTARQVWEGMLTELSKVNAPSMLLADFNYFFNKAINQYINKRYNNYDINQLTTDDLRVLKSTAILKPNKMSISSSPIGDLTSLGTGVSKLFGATYEINLPLDYLHMLNCICIYEVKEPYQCFNTGDNVLFAATRLTADAWSTVVGDYYHRPLPERPYYYIHNVNTLVDLPTNPVDNTIELTRTFRGTDTNSDYIDSTGTYNYVVKYEEPDSDNEGEIKEYVVDSDKVYTDEYEVTTFLNNHPKAVILETTSTTIKSKGSSNLPRTIYLNNITNKSVVEREAGVRYGNPSGIRCEIRYGLDDSVFKLIGVMVDYIKTPLTIRLTQELVNRTRDTSLIMEFPDSVCHEIINELVTLVMENTADPRLQTHPIVTQSIANPVQALTPQQTAPRRRYQYNTLE